MRITAAIKTKDGTLCEVLDIEVSENINWEALINLLQQIHTAENLLKKF